MASAELQRIATAAPPRSYATFSSSSPAASFPQDDDGNGSNRYDRDTYSVARSSTHPQQRAWCGSRLLLSWVLPLMQLGHSKQLDAHDVWPLRKQMRADVASRQFRADFCATQSLSRAFARSFGWRFALTGLGFLVSMLCNLFGPVVLHQVVASLTSLSSSDSSSTSGVKSTNGASGINGINDVSGDSNNSREYAAVVQTFVWVGALFASQLVQALVDTFASLDSEVMAIQFIAGVKALLYAKTLALSAEARQQKSTGDIANIFTSDSDAITAAAFLVHQAWLIPLQIALVSAMLYSVLDIAAFAGIGMILLILGVNHVLATAMFRRQRVYRASKDVRMKKVTEVFKAIGVIKLNAWEDRFAAQIRDARAIEMRDLFARRMLVAWSIGLLWGMPVFISVASFGVFTTVVKRELTPAIVFSSVALFGLIQRPLRQITQIIPMLVQSKVGLERVSAFLDMSEVNASNVLTDSAPAANEYIAQNVVVAVEDGEFSWDAVGGSTAATTATTTTTTATNSTTESSLPSPPPLLRDVNLQIRTGEFYVVHGPVGCGKSSLCAALLGEMVKRRGRVFVGGRVAYCSQQPWIQNMTVRDNILFGSAFERAKYDKVLDACALTADLAALPAGDNTEIGERGVNVSGGQKARIALARACYSDADVYILDSPLSAVDAIVQNEIFTKCLLGLLRHKTIMLVTHSPEIIASTHITHAITIDATGAVVETHRVLERREHTPLVSPLPRQIYQPKSYDSDMDATTRRSSGDTKRPTYAEVAELNDELTQDSLCQGGKNRSFSSSNLVALETQTTTTGKLIADEERFEGRVSGHVFSAYYRAVGGLCVLLVFVSSQIVWQVLQVSSDFWLGAWSSDSVTQSSASTPSNAYRLGIYAALGFASASMVLVRMLLITVYGLRAARNLFDQMTHALLHAPMQFFDTNPIGRILTRYGGDVSIVDTNIPPLFGRLVSTVFSVGFSTVTAAIVIQWRGLLLIPVMALYLWLGAFYIQPARELQRLSKTTQAPVLNHLSESVDGGSTIRAFGSTQARRFVATNYATLDANNKIAFAQLYVSQWFSLRIQLIGSVFVLVVTSSLVLLRHELGVAVIGLAFSYALKVSQNLEQLVQIMTMVESMMVSPERIQEYIDIPQEAPHRIKGVDPSVSLNWPFAGSVQFTHVSFRYKDGDRLVLTDLSFTVKGGEKIGIVGRTGAGKSSLTMALFRINELASGSVRIDGVDVGKVGLKALREKLSIIPQNPVLFKGPLRSYLDPFSEFSDAELWHCVKQVGLSDRIASDEHKLECVVEENGENFSVGERQMLCMARALLRHSHIVIFDEATAAIDHETDKQLQQVIRTAFAKSTVLTIAHRLDTVLDADRILVLDGGRIVEFAPPTELVQRGSGHFFELMKEGGYLDKVHAP